MEIEIEGQLMKMQHQIFNIVMIEKKNEGDMIVDKSMIFIEASKKQLKPYQLYDLYQSIISFTNDHHRKEDASTFLLELLPKIQNQHIFAALLAQLLERASNRLTSYQESLQNSILQYVNTSQSKFKKTIVRAALRDHGLLQQKLIANCRTTQAKSQMFLQLLNEVLVESMKVGPVSGMNFTHSTLFALKCIEHGDLVSESLCQQALRHLLIVDLIQKGEIGKIILENEGILSKLVRLGEKQWVSGFWYMLVAKLYSDEASSFSSLYDMLGKAINDTYSRINISIDTQKDLSNETQKILYSNIAISQKLNYLHKIRGIAYFVSIYTQILIREGNLNRQYLQIIQSLMQIKDFMSFEFLAKAYVEAFDSQQIELGFELSPNLVKSIQQNCLPILSSSTKLEAYDITEVGFLSFTFESTFQIRVSAKGSALMNRIMEILMQSRGCKHKQKICNCCQEYIHSAIEKQYDHDFRAHEFMSACHLMCREISRVVAISPEESQVQELKQYLINNLKWLLNLNESCLPKYRKCINFKIFDLMIAFPPLLRKNEFLREVVQDLLINRLPESLTHLEQLIHFYSQLPQSLGSNEGDFDRQSNVKIGQKLLKKCGDEVFGFEQKIKLLNLIVNIWEKDEAKLLDLLEVYTLHEDLTLAKHIVLKKKKLKVAEKIEIRANAIQQKMQSNQFFFASWLATIHAYVKSD